MLISATFLQAFETYPYRAKERESLGAILYSIGAKRLWGSEGSVLKHTKINQIKMDHEFKDNEMIRLAKEDIRFKCNVILRGDILVIKRALVSKKDRQKLLRDEPTCLSDKIVQLAKKKVKIYASANDYVQTKTNRYKSKIFAIDSNKKTKKFKKVPKRNIRIKTTSIKSTSTKSVKTKLKMKGEHRFSFISARNQIVYSPEGADKVSTVTNSNGGILYEHLQKENGKGLMANFSLAAMSVNADPNYSYDVQGFLSYELGYNFNDKFMLATSLRVNKQQYINENAELSDLNISEFLIHSIYRTSFLKKDNLISLSAGGAQTDNNLQGYSVGLRSEILADSFSFSVFYQLRNLYNEQDELSQNLFGLSIGRVF